MLGPFAMFHLTRRLYAGLPLAWMLIGALHQPWLLPVPALALLLFLLARHRYILGRVGSAAWASDGFARHVMVDDLLRLAGWVAVSPLVFFLGQAVVEVVGR